MRNSPAGLLVRAADRVRQFVGCCATLALGVTMAIGARPAHAEPATSKSATSQAHPYMAQVVGLQWLNPLERMDYPTEWQLLWTLGLVKPNKGDDMVKLKPQKYSKLQAVSGIVDPNRGRDSFEDFHKKYVDKFVNRFRDIYFSDSNYFYNAHDVKDKSTWRELAGIRVEYAIPAGRLDSIRVADTAREIIIDNFDIGLRSFPNSWTRSTPPDVRVTQGGANAGFASLSAALDYLQAHPKETVWVMNWDAPSYPPKDEQINENMVLLILAGPDFKTERAPLAWLGYPASAKVADFDNGENNPRAIQAWKSAVEKAAHNAGKHSALGAAIRRICRGGASVTTRDRARKAIRAELSPTFYRRRFAPRRRKPQKYGLPVR